MVAMGQAMDLLGWRLQEAELEGGTVGDLLRLLPATGGRSAWDVLAEGGRLRPGFALLVNGHLLDCGEALAGLLKEGDQVLAMELVHAVRGG